MLLLIPGVNYFRGQRTESIKGLDRAFNSQRPSFSIAGDVVKITANLSPLENFHFLRLTPLNSPLQTVSTRGPGFATPFNK